MRTIRRATDSDVPHIRRILEEIKLFPPNLLDDMIFDFLHNQRTEELWLVCMEEDKLVAFGYSRPEKLTHKTYNFYALGVLPSKQGKGIGKDVFKKMEYELRRMGARIVLVESSGTKDYKKAREMYKKLGYTEEARIHDFWSEANDKIIYLKKLV